jgi:enoyl-CoA hydratase/carnithine racemase
VYEFFAGLPQPTIAAISGYCIGGGFEMALGADLRIADDTAVFDLPEVAYGVVTSGAAYRLTRLVGPSRTKELLLFRRRLSAREAEAFGHVSEVLPAGRLLERAVELAETVAGLPPDAARRAKAVIEHVLDAPRGAAVALEQATYVALSQTGGSRRARDSKSGRADHE